MPKISPDIDRNKLLTNLGKVYDALCEKHSKEIRTIGNKIPVGGGDWMDLFFCMEGIRGVMTSLRHGKGVKSSIQFGKDTSTIAVKLWNRKREYQVHRWEQTVHDYIEQTVRRCL